MKKRTRYFLFAFAFLFIALFLFLFAGEAPRTESVAWGVNFSQKHAINLGLDWKETYLALLDDLGAKRLKIAVHWDYIEGEAPGLFFDDVDWQMKEVEKRGVQVLLVIGQKTPRWPECHIPQWAKDLKKQDKQDAVLRMLAGVVSRYKDSPALWGWQVENEPFFPFGQCPGGIARSFLKKEADMVRSLDPNHPIVISESGEASLWFDAAYYGDIVGITLYQKAWFRQLGMYIDYPLPPVFYWRKAQLVNALFHKDVIGVELQAEPWGPSLVYNVSSEEQEKTMNIDLFRDNVEFARRTGLKTFYFWGGEWWYWMKEKQNHPEIWDEARNIFKENL